MEFKENETVFNIKYGDCKIGLCKNCYVLKEGCDVSKKAYGYSKEGAYKNWCLRKRNTYRIGSKEHAEYILGQLTKEEIDE